MLRYCRLFTKFMCIFFVLAIAACAQNKVTWCPPGESACLQAQDIDAIEGKIDQWYKTSKTKTNGLSVSYNLLVEAVLKNVLKENKEYCLVVLNDKPDQSLLNNLIAEKHDPLACENAGLTISVMRIDEPSPNEFKVMYSYNCGSLCGGRFVAELKEENNYLAVIDNTVMNVR